MYAALGRLDHSYGAADWWSALHWLDACSDGHAIAEIQFWGHGKWGKAFIGSDVFSARTLLDGSPLAGVLARLRRRMTPNASFWFRTCETFGALAGQDFARAFSDAWGCRVAGHTYVIHHWQSGLHAVQPGQRPSWSPEEGLQLGSPAAPKRALQSSPWAPHTVTALTTTLPPRFLAG